MNVPTLWQCPNCDEQHHDEFDICWKCGSDPAGNRDPDFHMSESATELDQTPESPTSDTQIPSLRLPNITYFSIPPYTWFCLYMMFNDFEASLSPVLHQSPITIVVYCFASVLISIPMGFTMVRASFHRRHNLSSNLADALWLLSVFRLPESIRESQRWFVLVYYGSIGAMLVASLGLMGWNMIRFISP